MLPPQHLTAEAVAALPPPGLSGPSSLVFSPDYRDEPSGRYLAFVSSSFPRRSQNAPATNTAPTATASSSSTGSNTTTSSERQLYVLDLLQQQIVPQPLLRLPNKVASKRRMLDDHTTVSSNTPPSTETNPVTSQPTSVASALSLEERFRRERQRIHASTGSLVQFSWCAVTKNPFSHTIRPNQNHLRLLVPIRGSLYIQNGILDAAQPLQLVYDKAEKGDAVDPQLSPDGTMVAFVVCGDIYVRPATPSSQPAVRLTFGANASISHGLADFVAQEEIDRYRGYWWHPDSRGILFARLDESKVPPYRIIHQDSSAVALASTTTTTTSASSDDPNASNSTGTSSSTTMAAAFEDHRYPFAGKDNPSVKLGFVVVDRDAIFRGDPKRGPMSTSETDMMIVTTMENSQMHLQSAYEVASENWSQVQWFSPPREAPEYLARLTWLPDGSACAQWQNRTQSTLVLMRVDLRTGKARTLLVERSDVWINLHHMMKVLPRPVHPDDCCGIERNIPPVPNPLPKGSFSFLFASERTGYCHLYLYTFVPGFNGDQAILIRAISGREWIVESISGIDMNKDLVYFTGTYDSVLERHLYALPITNNHASLATTTNSKDDTQDHGLSNLSDGGDHHVNPNGVRRGLKQVMNALSGKSRQRNQADLKYIRPTRLTPDSGMHNIIMDDDCRLFVDTSSDLDRPTTVKIYELPEDLSIYFAGANGGAASWSSTTQNIKVRLLWTLYDATHDDKSLTALCDAAFSVGGSIASVPAVERPLSSLPAPEFLSFPTSDGSETLHATLYRPDPRVHGPGPYPLICAVYGGPHVQRVNRSWSQCADMRAQRLRSMGFCVVKCDNRGSSRRGIAFESAISRRLGRLEVLDQVATVRQLTLRGIADPSRVGIYGWSYGGYLSAMCLCRAPDVFHVAVAGAPVTSWDGYDTHYTERYMGLPSENPTGYRESAVFDHIPNMRGKLMIVHGLLDENVHFRHTARLINRLIASGKDYDLLLFPDERHSPRRLRDRIYMEQRISSYFLRHLGPNNVFTIDGNRPNAASMRPVAGHL